MTVHIPITFLKVITEVTDPDICTSCLEIFWYFVPNKHQIVFNELFLPLPKMEKADKMMKILEDN